MSDSLDPLYVREVVRAIATLTAFANREGMYSAETDLVEAFFSFPHFITDSSKLTKE